MRAVTERGDRRVLRVAFDSCSISEQAVVTQYLRGEQLEFGTPNSRPHPVAQSSRATLVIHGVQALLSPGSNSGHDTEPANDIAAHHVWLVDGATPEPAFLSTVDLSSDSLVYVTAPTWMVREEFLSAIAKAELKAAQKANALRVQYYDTQIANDLKVAKHIINNLGAEKSLDLDYVEFYSRPVELLNGDFMASAASPEGAQFFIVADFTGHGLPAAIGALVAHGTFTSMVSKNHSVETIVAELNRKMRNLLPTGRFLAASVFALYADSGIVSIWNGGMPDVLIRDENGNVSSRFPSQHPALGILDEASFSSEARTRELKLGYSIFAYSDGVTESMDAGGDLFGSARLESAVAGKAENVVDSVLDEIQAFRGTQPQCDDVSMLLVTFDPGQMVQPHNEKTESKTSQPPMDWQFSLQLESSALKRIDPVPIAGQIIDHMQGFGPKMAEIYVVLTELFSNALEHGLLELDSAIKSNPTGFSKYYQARETRLGKLTSGFITITCKHTASEEAGLLEISLRQSSNGRKPPYPTKVETTDPSRLHGRGTSLVLGICDTLKYLDGGLTARVTYSWNRN